MNTPFKPKESDLILGPFIKTIITLFFAPVIILIFSGPLLLAGNTAMNLIAYGQIQQQQLDNTTTANTATTVTTNNIGVKITSPTKGQQAPVGILKVEGTSTDSPTTDCQVSVILNNVKPYQLATPTGSGGQNDYSTWSYMLAPNYAVIEQGVNKITSKLSCGNNGPSTNPATGTNNPITKWYSVNVTGTKSSIAEGQEGEEQQQQQQLSNPIPLPTVSSEQKESQRKGAAAVDALPDSDIDSEGYDTFFEEDPFFKGEK